MLREKKKSRKKAITYRRVEMTPLLLNVMKDWVKKHPGGQSTFVQNRTFGEATPVTRWQAIIISKRLSRIRNGTFYEVFMCLGIHLRQTLQPLVLTNGSSTNSWDTKQKRCVADIDICSPHYDVLLSNPFLEIRQWPN